MTRNRNQTEGHRISEILFEKPLSAVSIRSKLEIPKRNILMVLGKAYFEDFIILSISYVFVFVLSKNCIMLIEF